MEDEGRNGLVSQLLDATSRHVAVVEQASRLLSLLSASRAGRVYLLSGSDEKVGDVSEISKVVCPLCRLLMRQAPDAERGVGMQSHPRQGLASRRSNGWAFSE